MEKYLETPWFGVSTPVQQLRIKTVVKAIYQHLTRADFTKQPLSLAGGTTGICIFWAQATLYLNQSTQTIMTTYLGDIFNRLADSQFTPGLYSGLCGIGWLTDYLQINSPQEDNNNEIDQLLQSLLNQNEIWQGEYELVNGLIGIGVYALARNTLGQGNALLTQVLNQLNKLSVTSEHGIHWVTATDNVNQQQHNLGLAHGVPGVVAFLTGVLNKRPELKATITPLLTAACQWLKSQVRDDLPVGLYPSNSASNQICRIGWCYGDLSNALTLLRAGKILGQRELVEFALKVATNSVNRDKSTFGIRDTAICHGSAGLVLIYQRLHQLTGNIQFSQEAQYWLEHVLTQAEKDLETLSGLHAFDGKASNYHQDLSLLEGISGVGLALIAADSDISPDWDEILLLS
ncbi:MAG: lanthionine synthetase C family protein [Algicola sp.]|nr:lanthionine synthetase C family protein [Algicola sp.]